MLLTSVPLDQISTLRLVLVWLHWYFRLRYFLGYSTATNFKENMSGRWFFYIKLNLRFPIKWFFFEVQWIVLGLIFIWALIQLTQWFHFGKNLLTTGDCDELWLSMSEMGGNGSLIGAFGLLILIIRVHWMPGDQLHQIIKFNWLKLTFKGWATFKSLVRLFWAISRVLFCCYD